MIWPVQFPPSNGVRIPCMENQGDNLKNLLRWLTQTYFCSLLHSFENSALFYYKLGQLSKVIWPVQFSPSNYVKIPCMVDQGDNLNHLFWRLTQTFFSSLLHLFENSALFYYTGGQLSNVIWTVQLPPSKGVKIPCMVNQGDILKHMLWRLTLTYFAVSCLHLKIVPYFTTHI